MLSAPGLAGLFALAFCAGETKSLAENQDAWNVK